MVGYELHFTPPPAAGLHPPLASRLSCIRVNESGTESGPGPSVPAPAGPSVPAPVRPQSQSSPPRTPSPPDHERDVDRTWQEVNSIGWRLRDGGEAPLTEWAARDRLSPVLRVRGRRVASALRFLLRTVMVPDVFPALDELEPGEIAQLIAALKRVDAAEIASDALLVQEIKTILHPVDLCKLIDGFIPVHPPS